MPSPFPGMDPFLEAHWGDVHTRLAASISTELRRQLPAGLVARIEERVVLEIAYEDEYDAERKHFYPDVGAFDSQNPHSDSGSSGASVIAAIPLRMKSKYVRRTLRTVNVHERKGMRVVTAIEPISPANKVGIKNRAKYVSRQELFLDGGVNLVEIDLIRQGQHVVYCPPIGKKGHYAISVVRGWNPEEVEVYPARFDAPLPTIKIPLRESDADALLELQPLLNRAYFDGDYENTDYTESLIPPFNAAENRWLKAQLKKRA